MNKIKSLMIAAVALCGMAITSCTDKMDWQVDPQFDRLFGITSLSANATATSIDINFEAPQGADRYEIQWSTDTLTDAEDSPANVKSMLVEKHAATIENLIGDTYYFLRIRALSDSKACSKWVYPIASNGKRSVHTLKEQILYPIADADRGQDYIHVAWEPNKEVTHILVTDPEGNELRYDLDDAAKAACEYTITGLQPLTSYTIGIYLNEGLRGQLTASTTAAAPKGDYTFNMPETMTVLDNETMKMIAEEAKAASSTPDSYTATIVVPAGVTIDMVGTSEAGEPASLKIPDGMSVTFFGAAGTTPVVKLSKSINLAGSHAFVRFENLVIYEGGCQYMFNQSEACTVDELSFKDCTFESLARAIVRVQGSNAVVINSINLTGCTIANIPDSYYAFDLRGTGQAIGKFSMDATTVYNVGRFFQNTGNDMTGGVTISNSTFYDIIASGRYLADCNGKNSDITFDKVVLGKTKEGARGVRTNTKITANGLRTSDCIFSSNDFKAEVGFEPSELSSNDVFAAPDACDFTLKVDDKVGDPRWYKKSAE